MSEKIKKSVRIYGTGGAGINLALSVDIPSEAAGFPETFITLVDTSDSNIKRKGIEKHNVFLIAGVSGAGKDRAFAYEVANPQLNKILLQNPPADLNIVIMSLAGGSGSVLGPLILAELIERGEQAIGICIVSTASGKESKNSFNTIGTLQNISTQKLKKPIICAFYENSLETNRLKVDAMVEEKVRAIAMLASGMNEELDHRDLTNFLRFDQGTKIPPQVVDLLVYIEDQKITAPDITAISVASLLPSKADSVVELGQAYSCVGYFPENALNATTIKLAPTHFILSNRYMNTRVNNLKDVIAKYDENEQLNIQEEIPEFHSGDTSGFLF